MPGPLLLLAAPTLAKVGGALVVFIIMLTTTLVTAKSYDAPAIVSMLCVFASMAVTWKFYSFMTAPERRTDQYAYTSSQSDRGNSRYEAAGPASVGTPATGQGMLPPPNIPSSIMPQ